MSEAANGVTIQLLSSPRSGKPGSRKLQFRIVMPGLVVDVCLDVLVRKSGRESV